MLYDGKPVELTGPQEEMATFFATVDPEGPQLGNPQTAKTFIKNFFNDFKARLGSGHTIRKFELWFVAAPAGASSPDANPRAPPPQ